MYAARIRRWGSREIATAVGIARCVRLDRPVWHRIGSDGWRGGRRALYNAAMKLTLTEALEAKNLDLGTSPWFRIDQERIDGFAEATEDRQWIHTDPERAARETEFGGTIAHGYLVLSLLPKLFFDVVEFSNLGMMVNMGIDKVRFLSPVPSGSEVHLKVRLLSSRKRSGGVLMRIRGDIRLRETGRRALVVETLFLAHPKEDPAD